MFPVIRSWRALEKLFAVNIIFVSIYCHADQTIEKSRFLNLTSSTQVNVDMVLRSKSELDKSGLQLTNGNNFDFENEMLIVVSRAQEVLNQLEVYEDSQSLDIEIPVKGDGCGQTKEVKRPLPTRVLTFALLKSLKKVTFSYRATEDQVCQMIHDFELKGLTVRALESRVQASLNLFTKSSRQKVLDGFLRDVICPRHLSPGQNPDEYNRDWVRKNIGKDYWLLIKYLLDLGADPQSKQVTFGGNMPISLFFRTQDPKARKMMSEKGGKLNADEKFLLDLLNNQESASKSLEEGFRPTNFSQILEFILGARYGNSHLVKGEYIRTKLSKDRLHQVIKFALSHRSKLDMRYVDPVLRWAAKRANDMELLAILAASELSGRP